MTPSGDEKRPARREELWDQFIDELDRAGQAGDASGVLIPADVDATMAGRRFGELTPIDVKALVRIASSLGRRSETINTLYTDKKRRLKLQQRREKTP